MILAAACLLLAGSSAQGAPLPGISNLTLGSDNGPRMAGLLISFKCYCDTATLLIHCSSVKFGGGSHSSSECHDSNHPMHSLK